MAAIKAELIPTDKDEFDDLAIEGVETLMQLTETDDGDDLTALIDRIDTIVEQLKGYVAAQLGESNDES